MSDLLNTINSPADLRKLQRPELKTLADELREKRWADFARKYNGVNYAINKYDTKLAAEFVKAGGIA